MSNTDFGTGRRADRGKGRVDRPPVSPSARLPVFGCLLLTAICLLLSGCRMDMQDQPRYEYYEPGDKKFFADGASSRATVEGTVARQPGGAGAYRDRDEYFYTGKAAGVANAGAAQPGAGARTGGQAGGVGAAVPNMQAGMAAGS